MSPAPKIDIVIPMWNEAARIGRVLDALVAQTRQDFRVTIFDNCSTDNGPDICLGYTDRLDIHLNAKTLNIGQNANINRSFLNATADYVAICSANDVLAPDYLEQLATVLDREADVGVAYAKAIRVGRDGNPLTAQPRKWAFYSADQDDLIARACMVIEQYRQPSNFFALYRRTVLDRMMPQPFRFGGDNVFVCEAALYGKIRCIEEAVVYQSISPGLSSMPDRMRHLMRMFSMDHERGLPEGRALGALEQLCPIIDMYHAHLDMFRLARLPYEQRTRLITEGSRAFLARRGDDIEKNTQRVIIHAGEFIDRLTPEDFSHRMFIHQMLRKIDQCLLLLQPAELIALRQRYADLYVGARP